MSNYVRETSIEKYIARRAQAFGWTYRRLKWRGRRGAPDDVLLKKPARIVFVEAKTKGGKLEDHQVREHARLRDLGFQVEVLWNTDQVEAFFNAND